MWFETLTGFAEEAVDDVASQFTVDGEFIVSRCSGRRMRHGRFETPSLAELRARCGETSGVAPLRFREVVADIRDIHTDPANAGATIQVASQFNTLEMAHPALTPEHGITRYAEDDTQGPACAIACGAGTIYRNYLIPHSDRIGQTATHQINCLSDVTTALAIDLEMCNGYAFATSSQLGEITAKIAAMNEYARDQLLASLRIGVHANTEVTRANSGHTVCQVYCSALPVAYSEHSPDSWQPFAQLVLDAAYEATFATALLNAKRTGNGTLFLTLLGGGVFGNANSWILSAVQRALDRYRDADLDVVMVSYGQPHAELCPLLR